MEATLRRMREKRDDRGFTLIELLVVVVIIGVLVAIAIPMYLNYRKGAANKSAESDIRGAISAVEQFYTDNSNQFPADATSAVSTNLVFAGITGAAQTATVSPGNTLGFKNNGTTYVLCAFNADGGQIYVYNSLSGGAVKKSGQNSLANCLANGN